MKIINLLPKDKQQELRLNRLFGTLVSLIWLACASFILVLLAQIGTKVFLQGEDASLKIAIEDLKAQASKEENAEIKSRIRELNDIVADYRSISSTVPKLSYVIRRFAPLVPESVSISSMRVDAAKKQIDISGLSPTRESVIQLYENVVAQRENFPNIDYPLENVARPTDISFHFTFNINPELLK
ncbi:MAG: hypothetical protein HYZ51_02010 [Candidatus Doudnabacteria bacterium]|nr:hypothetical protein [Candidatus Doudnabacteria bacterium]